MSPGFLDQARADALHLAREAGADLGGGAEVTLEWVDDEAVLAAVAGQPIVNISTVRTICADPPGLPALQAWCFGTDARDGAWRRPSDWIRTETDR
jgi:hypothetical protein